MKMIKRSGSEETFRIDKIIVAIQKANRAGEGKPELDEATISEIARNVENRLVIKLRLVLTVVTRFPNILRSKRSRRNLRKRQRKLRRNSLRKRKRLRKSLYQQKSRSLLQYVQLLSFLV